MWNMGCATGAYRAAQGDAWGYLVEVLRPDIALVQETHLTPPLTIAGRGTLFARGAWNRTKGWGSGVWIASMMATESELFECDGVHCAMARIEAKSGPVLIASVHVATNEQAQWLASLRGALERLLPDHRLIVGGDFNATRHWDKVHGGKFYTTFFDSMQAAGFFECYWRLHGGETQTFWGRQSIEAYQDDHFFVNESLGSKVVECEVIDNPTVRKLSDHAPVRLEIEL
jgi:endonuclease/exonuclease/phosphatase family metal-dependent hydrolase